MSSRAEDLETVLAHLEAIKPICAALRSLRDDWPLRDRRLALNVCARISDLHVTVVENLGITASTPSPSPFSPKHEFTDPWSSSVRKHGAYSHHGEGNDDDEYMPSQEDDDEDMQPQDNNYDSTFDDGHLEQHLQEQERYPEDSDNEDGAKDGAGSLPNARAAASAASCDTRLAEAAERVDKITHAIPCRPLSLEHVNLLLFGPCPKSKLAVREDDAFLRLLGGLPVASLHDWAEAFGAHAHNASNVSDIMVRSKANDSIRNPKERIDTRHKAILEMEQGFATTSTVVFVLLQIETVKFALDWQRRLSAEGGRTFITAFYKTAFIANSPYADEFRGLGEAATEAKLAQLKKPYTKWRSGAWKVVTARNRLLKLYNMFGPAVFLDPTWAVCNLVRGRSRSFVAVWDQLDAFMKSNKPALPCPLKAKDTVVTILTVLGGKPIGDHIKEFLDSVPPRPNARHTA